LLFIIENSSHIKTFIHFSYKHIYTYFNAVNETMNTATHFLKMSVRHQTEVKYGRIATEGHAQ